MKQIVQCLVCLFFTALFSCSKDNSTRIAPLIQPPVTPSYIINFKQDAQAISFLNVTGKLEQIAGLLVTAINGKFADTINKPNALVFRVTGDAVKEYKTTEIFATYIDSTGATYNNISTDNANKVTITTYKKGRDGFIQGSFELHMHNAITTKKWVIKEGDFKVPFTE